MFKQIKSFYCVNLEKINIKNRKAALIQSDTDSCMFCIDELFNYYKHIISQEKFLYLVEEFFENFWKKILNIYASKYKIENKIKFNRENLCSSFFSFAKKLYVAAIIDSEGVYYGINAPKHKNRGLSIVRSDTPEFCKLIAEKLVYDIVDGLNYSDALNVIKNTYKEFCLKTPNEISAKKSISKYSNYVKKPIDYYIKYGLKFELGMPNNVKNALAYNYIIKKENLKMTPILNGNKFNYIYVKPNNKFNIESIAWFGDWPNIFEKYFEIDYEKVFVKTFIPIFESMFKILKWIPEKGIIEFKENKLNKFFM